MDKSQIIALIDEKIKENENMDISGTILNEVLKEIVNMDSCSVLNLTGTLDSVLGNEVPRSQLEAIGMNEEVLLRILDGTTTVVKDANGLLYFVKFAYLDNAEFIISHDGMTTNWPNRSISYHFIISGQTASVKKDEYPIYIENLYSLPSGTVTQEQLDAYRLTEDLIDRIIGGTVNNMIMITPYGSELFNVVWAKQAGRSFAIQAGSTAYDGYTIFSFEFAGPSTGWNFSMREL